MSFQRAEERGEQLCVGVCHRPDKEHDSGTPQEAAGVEGAGGVEWRELVGWGGGAGWCGGVSPDDSEPQGEAEGKFSGGYREIGWKIKRQKRGGHAGKQ